ncbi:glutaredoxin family protein [Pseudonocardia sp.]|uniref:glutaredoxin family protein n=1 Tax=Pseudonocardia sp. TaxID=60912 RepID=UPI003D0AE1FC
MTPAADVPADVPAEVRVLVYTRSGCTACVAAERDVERVCGELGQGWAAVDVDTDPELRAEYGDRVPVIMVDGREHGFWRVEEPRLRAALGG